MICIEPLERQHAPHRQTPSQGTRQHQVAIALNFVCEYFCFISIYFVHLLERYVIRCQKSLGEGFWGFWEHSTIFLYKLVVIAFHFTPFQLAKVFIGMLYFLIMGETYVIPSCFIELYVKNIYMKNISSSPIIVLNTSSYIMFSVPFIIIHMTNSLRIWFQTKVSLGCGTLPSISHWALFSPLCFSFAVAARKFGVLFHFNYSNFISLRFWMGDFRFSGAGVFNPFSMYQLHPLKW